MNFTPSLPVLENTQTLTADTIVALLETERAALEASNNGDGYGGLMGPSARTLRA